jgi:hypothetical protein
MRYLSTRASFWSSVVGFVANVWAAERWFVLRCYAVAAISASVAVLMLVLFAVAAVSLAGDRQDRVRPW